MSSTTADLVPEGQQQQPDYSNWSNSSLISRITELERQLHSQTTQYVVAPPPNVVTHDAATVAAGGPAPPSSTSIDTTKPVEEPSNHTTDQGIKKRPHSPGDGDITQTAAPTRAAKKGAAREIDPSKYNTRFIALKFAYLGQRYNGYEHANGNVTPLPTIEEELWKAFRRTRLILPTNSAGSDDFQENPGPRVLKPYSIDWEGCQYSKAGRTDRGVSAFGQVIGIRVRSARPKRDENAGQGAEEDTTMQDESKEDSWDDVADELPYISLLNRVLPEDIRMLAWCPRPPPDFDARFSCRERQYRYFFTQPAFSPTPGSLGFTQRGPAAAKTREGWLDIDAMRKAAKYFEGVHDFRNFCKLDASKQIENFQRIIYRADIELVDPRTNLGYVGQPAFQALEDTTMENGIESPSAGKVYTFTLHGSAFLWHQVRHMVNILFLVAQGLEEPSIVAELLDVTKNPRKPTYEMASDAPLVLWNCIFPDASSGSREDALEWIYAGDPRMFQTQSGKGGDGKFGLGGVVEGLWSVWRQRKVDEILASSLLDLAVSQGDQSITNQGGFRQGASGIQNRGKKGLLRWRCAPSRRPVCPGDAEEEGRIRGGSQCEMAHNQKGAEEGKEPGGR